MQTFYQYLMTYRHSLNRHEYATLAEHVFRDHSFPKMVNTYQELTLYFEMNADYLLNMSLFDEIWQKYLDYRLDKE